MEEIRALPFVTKIYTIVDDPSTDSAVAWSGGNMSFVVKDPHHFSMNLLPRYFKHCNFSTFIKQLNIYGFRKVDPDRWEFAHECFLKGQKQLLGSIRRKSCNHSQSQLGFEGEIQRLNEDKDAIVMQIVALKKEQESIDRELEEMQRRFALTENTPQQIMSFFQALIHNPNSTTGQRSQNSEFDGGKKRKLFPMSHSEEHKKTRPKMGLDCTKSKKTLTELGFVDPHGKSSKSLTSNGFEDFVPLLMDCEIRAGLLSKKLMGTCSLKDQSREICIERSDFVGVSDVEEMIMWDQVFVEESQFINYKVLSEMSRIFQVK